MKTYNNYTDKELSKELKELCFPQDSSVFMTSGGMLVDNLPNEFKFPDDVAVFTVSELFELLPVPNGGNNIVPFLFTGISRRAKDEGHEKYYCIVSRWKSFTANTMQDAVAKAIIALIKKGKLNFNTK